jgi:hypothetical protein
MVVFREHLRSHLPVAKPPILVQKCQIRVSWLSGGPGGLVLLFRELNVKLVLFTDPNVNTVQVLTVRTLFSP